MIKKLVLLGFALVLLVGLPLTIFVLQNQTKPQSSAAAVTTFSFNVPTDAVQVGQTFDVPITVNPGGQNQVSFVKITFTYDGTKLDKGSDSPFTISSGFTPLEQPQITCNANNVCQVSTTLSVGNNTANIIKSATQVGKMSFVAKANTDPSSPTQLQFVTGQNQALSVATSDQPAENVFQSGTPASITIAPSSTTGSGGSTDTTDTPTPSSTDTGTSSSGSTDQSGTSNTSQADQTGTTSAVSCSDFSVDTNAGAAPLTVTFSTTGSAPSDTIAKITFNYGDGLVDDVATGSGIGTNTATAQISHTYQSNGTYTATAVFTSSGGDSSSSTGCSKTVTVGTVAQNTGTTKGGLPDTGPGEALLLVGAAGAVLTVVGIAIIAGL